VAEQATVYTKQQLERNDIYIHTLKNIDEFLLKVPWFSPSVMSHPHYVDEEALQQALLPRDD
jgi:hypothetical protein